MNKKVDYLVVGQGLAGTFLAYQLMQKGKSVIVLDKGLKYSSSRVAAGVINPIVLRRYTVTWRAKEFLNYNLLFYERLDEYLGKQYHFNLPLKKLISSKDEIAFWQHRFDKGDVSEYIYKELTDVTKNLFPSEKFKVGRVKRSSWLNISDLLVDFRERFHLENSLLEEDFNFSELHPNQYKDIQFGRVVFCEGARGKHNPLFKNLPFSLNKGQLITIKNSQLPSDSLLKKKAFILPTSKNYFKVGATYSWKWDDSTEETAHKIEEEKTDLLKSYLEEITNSSYKVVAIETGIRPSIKDRRPLIGRHPNKKDVYMFNGMGTRGCFMAPLLVEEFINYCEKGADLHSEVNINRFARLS